jgi:hypothetical protein
VGFKISWIGFDAIGKATSLEMLGLHDTGKPDRANEASFSGAEIPGGWFILFSNDFQFASPKRVAQLSADCRIVACQVHEGVMFSAAYGYERGNCVWELVHDAQRSINDLSVAGSPPTSFQSISQRQMEKQEGTAREEGLGVDYIFDIPVEVAADVCKYRHDRWQFEWGEPRFFRLDGRR